ncbi:MAG TPA: Wzz/FepE/Etk N-terminal domain-containing protein, partial [Sedimentisphaerales bacterium]|nr:Wzz/FepE/Etk N-terminal domain-containing protein [Sedimentisphaerales bacterium]
MTSSEGNGSKTQAPDKAVREEAEIYADEIDLRQYVQVLIKRKKLIIGTLLIAVILSAIAGLLLPKVYKASALIMVTPMPAISIPTHQTLLRSAAVLQEVINRLRLAGKLDEDLSLAEFSQNFEVKSTEQTNVLSLSVKDRDPARAKEAADIWADEYVKYSQQLIGEETLGSGEFVLEQFKRAEDDLAKADAAVRDFDAKERLSLMNIELAENANQLVSHYGKMHKLEFPLAEKRYLLQRTDENIAGMTKDGVWLGAFSITAIGEN